MNKPKATIVNAKLYRSWTGSLLVCGDCTSHEARADLVGEFVYTSKVVSYRDGVIETLNTLYSVEWLEEIDSSIFNKETQ